MPYQPRVQPLPEGGRDGHSHISQLLIDYADVGYWDLWSQNGRFGCSAHFGLCALLKVLPR